MAYDRYDTDRERERARHSDFDRDRERGRQEDRGFFERAGDEISSWFGGEESDHRRRDHDRDRYAYSSPRRDRERGRFDDEDRDSSRPMNWTSSQRDYRSGNSDSDRDFRARSGSRTGEPTGYDQDSRNPDRGGYDRSETPWGRDDYRRTSFAGSSRDGDHHYRSWRQRELDDLDRDYDDYRREKQQHFESDFGNWRQNRQQKRGFLGKIREHMDVVGSDGEQIGKVDCVKGDHIVLTKSDSEDDRHHSIKCTMIDTVEGDQVRLDVPAEEAKSRWTDGDEGHVTLERSFAGTYR